MAKDITYHSQGKAEENTPLVTILETNVEKKQSTAVDTRQSAYVVDLAKSAFGGVFYPIPGSQWYVKKIAGVWTLMSRAAQQNPQLDPGFTPAIGDTFLGGEGTTYITGDFQVTGQANVGLTGEMRMWAGVFAPTGWLLADGTSVSRTTYANLYNVVVPSLGVATITIATPGVVTCNSHGLIAGDTVIFTTTGSLPTGLLNSAYYFVIATGLTSNAFQLSASDGGAAINTTGSQSGVHTLRRAPYGIADATHFWLPPMPGRVPVGRDSTQTEFVRLGKGGGSKTHTLATGEIPSHNHTQNAHNHGITDPTHAHEQNVTADVAPGSGIRTDYNTDASSATFDQGVTTNSSGTGISINNATPTNNVTGGGGAHNNLQPYLAVNFIIKT